MSLQNLLRISDTLRMLLSRLVAEAEELAVSEVGRED